MLAALNIALSSIKASGKTETVEFSFPTIGGEVDFMADLSVAGDTVIFDNVCIYPRDALSIEAGKILRDVLKQKRALEDAIRDLGWGAVEMRGVRVPNSSSAVPGRAVRLERRVNP
jgi:hypothetical protein